MGVAVAVVGGGSAGLAAAQRLVREGYAVTLFERDGRMGGKLRTETIDGARVDTGVQLISSTHTMLFDVAKHADAGALLEKSPGRDALWRKDLPQPITYGSVASMVSSGALPGMLKLKLAGRYLPYLTSTARLLDANDLVGSGGAELDVESIAAWGAREVGEDFVELLVYPLLAAYYGALPEETSAAVYHALARVGIDVSVYAAAGGFGALADAVAASLAQRGVLIHAGVEVRSVTQTQAGVHIDAGELSADFDAVVVAVPAVRAAGLLPELEPSALTWLHGVEARRTFTVSLRVDRAFPGDYFGLSFPRTSEIGRTVAALCIQSRKLGGLVPRGDALVALPAPTSVPHAYERDDASIVSATLAVLEQAVKGISKRVTHTHVQRFEDAYSIFKPGHITALTKAQTVFGRIALAGDYLMAPSVEGAVRSGVRAAESVIRTSGDRAPQS